ncbi:unnamed protein product [Effrenium voratum]|nr:unnamed protein product [Effrenium voratum]
MSVEMLEQRAAEKERALQQEVDLLRKQKDSQVTSLRAQMEFQTAELRQTAEQEVALMKQEFERRERSLQQMLDQARLGQEEEQRTSEMQLALKLKRQEDQAEAQEAKIRALEESGKRQQELYERHVGQLTEQMRNSQDNFRKQLEAVQAENDESLQAAKGKFAEVERSLKSERERVVAEVQQEREEHASKLAQAEELSSRVGGMQKETEELRKQLLEARMKLLDRPFRREEAAAAAFAPQARRSSEPDVKADLAAGRRKSVRQLLLPLKLAEPQATSKGPKEKREEKPPARPRGSILKRRTIIAVTEKSEKVKLDLQALNHRDSSSAPMRWWRRGRRRSRANCWSHR